MTPFEALDDVKRRTAEAVIAQSGLADAGLRRRLRALLAGDDAAEGALLQAPVLEGAHPFLAAEATMATIAGGTLHADLVAALDALPADHDYRFPRTRRPFRHQAEAWELLARPEPQSALVTSGTGSGKTECFLMPILSDLVGQAAGAAAPLEGVQAIMLYPLNALIESQRERLSAWTAPFGGRLRYCLYNGDLPQTASESTRRRTPGQVIDRERLRASPPPVLVTNITMLEYMLARAEDRPILEASRGKLKWIVLDEAHSLVGAAAAEIALLLRRVMLAFAVAPEAVRFVATSATIGSGDEVREQLRRFLADVAGLPEARVHVIEGRRVMPRRPEGPARPPGDLASADPAALYDALGRDPAVWALVERLFAGAVPFADFAAPARALGLEPAGLVAAMARAARKPADAEDERLAPIRLHAFERAVPGLWSCVDPACARASADWPFGRLLPERADACPSCRAPVLEVISCNECGEAFLEGVETGPRLSAPQRTPPRDEFAFDSPPEIDGESADAGDAAEDAPAPEPVVSHARLFAARPTAGARAFWLDRMQGWRVADAPAEGGMTLACEEHEGPRACPHCNPTGGGPIERLRPLRFGAPFMLGNAAPILLDSVAPEPVAAGERLPSDGRRLLSFSDSRQGTARLAAKLQIESERNFVRSWVYHTVQASMRPGPDATGAVEKLRADIADLEAAYAKTPVPVLEDLIAAKKRDITKLTSGCTDGIAWRDLVGRLAERIEVSDWIGDIWRERDEDLLNSPPRVAEFLLLREFSRRPRRANSLETMGLARLRNPALDKLTSDRLPKPFIRRGKTLDDWRNYLDAVLTWFVRANGAVAITREMQHWVSAKAKLVSLIAPGRATDRDPKWRGWPTARGNPRARPVALLTRGLDLDRSSAADRDDLDECLQQAWNQVQATLSPDPERRVYDFGTTCVAPLVEAFWCPVTRRILDRAPFGLTPYGLDERDAARRQASAITLPRLPAILPGDIDARAARAEIRDWLAADPGIAELRERGAWRDLSDRIALFADYARAAEHSAQQQSGRLRSYEKKFKDGKINILNCSTTMEMGVDIGSVSTVMMTNAPPSIANYRQRVGRAGRRGQALALAFTFCKDRPLDREAFRDPAAFLARTLAAPRVTLSSRPIVQRHVNAWLLGTFMRERAGDALSMEIGAFFGCPADPEPGRPPKPERPVEALLDWLALPSVQERARPALATLTRRSCLEGDGGLIDCAREAMQTLSSGFVAEWEGFVALAKDEGASLGGKSRMAVELRRLCGEFLLGALADRGFLPGHGFPTDVVAFLPGREFKAGEAAAPDGRRQFRVVGPQRSLDLAIRDYAPGSEVVLDGLVHKSAGVTLNWKRPASEQNVAEVQSLRRFWRCAACGAGDTARGAAPEACPVCGGAGLDGQDFLRPAGFSVDPRERAHAETDTLTYVAPQPPEVAARAAPWRALPAPEFGRFRCTAEGLVYYSNRGPTGHGYAVCLHCGRAEADSPPGDGRPALAGHRPLRPVKGVEVCPGVDKPFSIRRNLAMGHEITTDVVELQPRHPPGPAAAQALAIALREGLAQELGVDADEMGFAVARRRNDLGQWSASLFLFDRASGGAGFATSLEHRLKPALRRAERILDCRTPGCEKACAACVLTPDAPDGEDQLDRTAALAFLRDNLAWPEALDEADRFAAGAELSAAPVDEIDRALRGAARSVLTLFPSTEAGLTGLQDWPLAAQFANWRQRGCAVRLALAPATPARLGAAERLALRDFAIRHDLELVVAEAPAFANGARAIAVVDAADGPPHVWATREADPRRAGPDWGRPAQASIACGRVALDVAATPIDLDSLRPAPGSQYREIDRELDGDLAGFGQRMAGLIVGQLQACGRWPRGAVTQALYRDPYVSSPLAARLLVDTIWRLVALSGATTAKLTIETREPRADDRSPPWRIGHDWRGRGEHKAVVERFGAERGLSVSLLHRDAPHGRYLSIGFADGATATVVLDQGFGAWAPQRDVRLRHDFAADAVTQARQLVRANALLHRHGAGKTYLVAAPGAG